MEKTLVDEELKKKSLDESGLTNTEKGSEETH